MIRQAKPAGSVEMTLADIVDPNAKSLRECAQQ